MAQDALSEFVEATATRFGIPGVAVGVWADGREAYACHGVTSVDNPLPVDPDTLFVLGSVTKTYTATALLLQLTDEHAAAQVTVLQLLNHTAGLDWGITVDTGEGDDALAAYVAKLADLKLIGPPGERASYSQAGYNLAGRIIEKVTGLTFERAVASLVLEPLGLQHSFFARDDVMTRRFAVGHNRDQDGILSIARLWRRWRGENPGGGLVSSVADQLRWARFHLGDDRAERGARVLPAELLQRMQQPTVALRGSNLGDAIGIGWFVRDIGGVRAVGHLGSANGQFAELLLVPDRGFAVVSLCNAFPDGPACNQGVVRWALEIYLGVADREPEPLPYDQAQAREVVGSYENEVMTLTISTDGARLTFEALMRPEIRAAADKELPPDYPPAEIGLLPGNKDEYVITSGGMSGLRGFFTRDQRGAIAGVDLAGRLFTRVPTAAQ